MSQQDRDRLIAVMVVTVAALIAITVVAVVVPDKMLPFISAVGTLIAGILFGFKLNRVEKTVETSQSAAILSRTDIHKKLDKIETQANPEAIAKVVTQTERDRLLTDSTFIDQVASQIAARLPDCQSIAENAATLAVQKYRKSEGYDA